jgi:hypothetical protein
MTPPGLLHRLVAYDTTSRNSNLELVGWAAALLETASARIRLTHDGGGAKRPKISCGPSAPSYSAAWPIAHVQFLDIVRTCGPDISFRTSESGRI